MIERKEHFAYTNRRDKSLKKEKKKTCPEFYESITEWGRKSERKVSLM